MATAPSYTRISTPALSRRLERLVTLYNELAEAHFELQLDIHWENAGTYSETSWTSPETAAQLRELERWSAPLLRRMEELDAELAARHPDLNPVTVTDDHGIF